MSSVISPQVRSADGLLIRYAESEVVSEPTVLLLNPWPESLYAWEALWPQLETQESYEPSDTARRDYLDSYAGMRFGESARYVRSYPTDLATLRDSLPGIQTPIQIIAGSRDPLVPPANAEYLHQRLPHSKLALLDTGHFAWEDCAEEWGSIALEWIHGGYRFGDALHAPRAESHNARESAR
jgi:hypothetical protein